jgi:hypothetical protein
MMLAWYQSEKSNIPETMDLSNPSSSIVLRAEQTSEQNQGPDGRAERRAPPPQSSTKQDTLGKRNATCDAGP